MNDRYKQFWLEKSKEEIIEAYAECIKNGEVLLERIENAIKYCEESNLTLKSHYFIDVIKILKGEIK